MKSRLRSIEVGFELPIYEPEMLDNLGDITTEIVDAFSYRCSTLKNSIEVFELNNGNNLLVYYALLLIDDEGASAAEVNRHAQLIAGRITKILSDYFEQNNFLYKLME